MNILRNIYKINVINLLIFIKLLLTSQYNKHKINIFDRFAEF